MDVKTSTFSKQPTETKSTESNDFKKPSKLNPINPNDIKKSKKMIDDDDIQPVSFLDKTKNAIISNTLNDFWNDNGLIRITPAFKDKYLTILDQIKPALLYLKKNDIENSLRSIFILMVMNELSKTQKVNLYQIKLHPTIESILKNDMDFNSYFNKQNFIFNLLLNLLAGNQKRFIMLIILVIIFIIVLLFVVLLSNNKKID